MIFIKDVLPSAIAFCSLLLSILTYYHSLKLNKQQYKLNDEEYQERVRVQANKLAIWIDISYLNELDEGVSKILPVFLMARNTSNLPIYDILVLNVCSFPEVTLDNFESILGVMDDEKEHFSYTRILPPGDLRGVINGRGSGMGKTDDIVYFFQDSSGNRWFRNNRGKLSEISDRLYYCLINKVGIMVSDLSVFSNLGSEYVKYRD